MVIARLPEKDRRRIAIENHHIAHRLDALRPTATGHVVLLVARRTYVHDAKLVKRPDRRGLRGDVHPPDEIRVGLPDERGVIILEPVRRNADCGPFVRRTLRVAREPSVPPVDLEAARRRIVRHFAEARPYRLRVENSAVFANKRDDNIVEMRRIGRPEDETARTALGLKRDSLRRSDARRLRGTRINIVFKRGHKDLAGILDLFNHGTHGIHGRLRRIPCIPWFNNLDF